MSVWHWIALLVVVAIPSFVIYRAVQSARQEGGIIVPGFHGWLLILAVGQWIGVLRVLADYGKMLNDPAVQASAKLFPLLGTIDAWITFATFLIAATTALFMQSKKYIFIRSFIIQYIWSVLTYPLSLMAAVIVLSTVYNTPVRFGDMMKGSEGDVGRWIGTILFGGLWLSYVLRSKRVAVTFTR